MFSSSSTSSASPSSSSTSRMRMGDEAAAGSCGARLTVSGGVMKVVAAPWRRSTLPSRTHSNPRHQLTGDEAALRGQRFDDRKGSLHRVDGYGDQRHAPAQL